MSKKAATVAIVVLAAYACLITLWAGVQGLEARAADILLQNLALARPGIRLSEIRARLGTPYGEFTKMEDVISGGRIKDKAFCQNRRLFRFYASTPPCRTIDVYTDTNDVIVYATWTGL